jgi:hypothetical protein
MDCHAWREVNLNGEGNSSGVLESDAARKLTPISQRTSSNEYWGLYLIPYFYSKFHNNIRFLVPVCTRFNA